MYAKPSLALPLQAQSGTKCFRHFVGNSENIRFKQPEIKRWSKPVNTCPIRPVARDAGIVAPASMPPRDIHSFCGNKKR